MPVITELSARALLLDMDGTLVNSDAVVERCWRRWAARQGLDGDAAMRVVHGRQGHPRWRSCCRTARWSRTSRRTG